MKHYFYGFGFHSNELVTKKSTKYSMAKTCVLFNLIKIMTDFGVRIGSFYCGRNDDKSRTLTDHNRWTICDGEVNWIKYNN